MSGSTAKRLRRIAAAISPGGSGTISHQLSGRVQVQRTGAIPTLRSLKKQYAALPVELRARFLDELEAAVL